VARLLACARSLGIDTLDTAVGYGESEALLGSVGVAGWRIVSKLPPGAWEGEAARLRERLEGCLARLGVPRLAGFLLHRSRDLLGPGGAALYRALAAAREAGLVERIGVSIYDPAELDLLVPRFGLDLVQAPFNVLDRRLETTGWLDRLVAGGTEVHTRSAFLQGLLVMAPGARPQAFARWAPLLAAWDRWLAESGQSAVQACLGFVLSSPGVDRVVVGFDNAQQLLEAAAAADGPHSLPPATLSSTDVCLIEPSRW
jgi:aryl-alcohol dehydrogenase-like predicted oxidoreductase